MIYYYFCPSFSVFMRFYWSVWLDFILAAAVGWGKKEQGSGVLKCRVSEKCSEYIPSILLR